MNAQKSLEELTAGELKLAGEEVTRQGNLLKGESDRGCILLAGALVDRYLESLLRLHMVEDIDIVDGLMGRGRPLESFGARAQAAACLGILEPYHCANLDVLRKIRNHSAHHPEDVRFSDQKLEALTKNFTARDGSRLVDDSNKEDSPRERFLYAMGHVAGQLIYLIAVSRHFERPSPFSWMSRGRVG